MTRAGHRSTSAGLFRSATVCFLASLAVVSPFGRAQTPIEPTFTVRMKGHAEGVGLTARKLAVENAQHQVMVDVLQSLTNLTDMNPFKPILRQASRYIQRCDLLRTDAVGNETSAEIDAWVLERPLRHDVATLMLPRLPRKPTVLLLIAEYIGPESASGGPTFSVAEAVFRKRIEDQGFTVSGVHGLLNHFEAEELIAAIHGDVAEAAAFCRANPEDVLVIGSVTTTHEPLASDSNMLRNRAAAALRVFAGPNGKMTDALSAQAAVQSVSPLEGGEQAVQDACGKLAGECIVSIVLTMLTLDDEERVLITVEQPANPEFVAALKQAIAEIPGVAGVEELFYSESLARLAVDYADSMAFFADMLSAVNAAGAVEVTRCVKREVTVHPK